MTVECERSGPEHDDYILLDADMKVEIRHAAIFAGDHVDTRGHLNGHC